MREVIVGTVGHRCDIVGIANEIRDADAELAHDQNIFEVNLSKLEAALTNDRKLVNEELIKLRISAMNISTIFSNLADEIETLVVYRIRNPT